MVIKIGNIIRMMVYIFDMIDIDIGIFLVFVNVLFSNLFIVCEFVEGLDMILFVDCFGKFILKLIRFNFLIFVIFFFVGVIIFF